jgi:hypothetical protein
LKNGLAEEREGKGETRREEGRKERENSKYNGNGKKTGTHF